MIKLDSLTDWYQSAKNWWYYTILQLPDCRGLILNLSNVSRMCRFDRKSKIWLPNTQNSQKSPKSAKRLLKKPDFDQKLWKVSKKLFTLIRDEFLQLPDHRGLILNLSNMSRTYRFDRKSKIWLPYTQNSQKIVKKCQKTPKKPDFDQKLWKVSKNLRTLIRDELLQLPDRRGLILNLSNVSRVGLTGDIVTYQGQIRGSQRVCQSWYANRDSNGTF